MKLVRAVERRGERTSIRGLIGTITGIAVGFALVSSFVVAPRVMKPYGESKSDIGAATVKKYAYEAYPSWSELHPDARCPGSLLVLNDYMNNKDTIDPWGNHYEMYCGPHGIVVHSLGEDGIRNSPDDIWSNR